MSLAHIEHAVSVPAEVEDVPLRPRAWTASAFGTLIGCAASAAALVWFIFALTPLAGGLGFALAWLVVFVAMYWLIERDLNGSLAATDRIAQMLIAAASVIVVGALAIIVVFVAIRGAKALRPGFFVKTSLCRSACSPPFS
jgi:hypothetical protein